MIDAAGDLAAILDDCGGAALTVNGQIVGRFLEEPTEVPTSLGVPILMSEPVFYTSRDEIAKAELVKGSWVDVDGQRWIVKEIPRSDVAGLVRLKLGQ